ncbi:MAG: hypothetical protein IH931_04370, partial [candidate division Zixibacteria bacterium]|nr:hypothetical protein [candidate division Zixibacteria bacterium]
MDVGPVRFGSISLLKRSGQESAELKPTKMKKSWEDSPYYVPFFFGLMLAGILILFGDFIFSGKMLYGTDTIQAGLNHRSMLINHFTEHGKIPQWDPHQYGGMPYVDAFHGDIFYPYSVLKFFVPLHFHLGFNLILHIFFAGVFMFLAARQFKLGKTAALFSAASYMFAAYLISMVASGHEGKIYVTALFPLVILFIERAFEQKPFLNFTLLGLILGIIILSPHPQMAYFTLWAAGLYTLYKLVVLYIRERTIRVISKPALLALYAVVFALLLSAIQFYPGYVYTTKFSPQNPATIGDLRQIVSQVKEETGFDAFEEVFSKWGQDEVSAPSDPIRFKPIRDAMNAAGFDAIYYHEPGYEAGDFPALVVWNPDIVKMLKMLQKQAPPGPPPRPGLEWKPETHRWIRPLEKPLTREPFLEVEYFQA